MQIYALGTGSFAAGALAMFLFTVGTVPLMFGLGAVISMLSRKFTYKMMKVSAALVITLGVVMANIILTSRKGSNCMNKETVKISGMTCAACAKRIEKVVGMIEGASQASVNFDTEKRNVEYNDHYGIDLGGGYVFEWAMNMSKNDKDIAFALNPQVFIDAGAEFIISFINREI